MVWPFKPRSRKTVARIEVTGAIVSATRQRVLKAIKLVETKKFPALLLRIDSPGGTVGDSQEIYEALKRLRSKGVHVVASFGNISASGGVYIAMGADHIVSNPGTITGSIGVILRGNNIEPLLEKIGVSFKVIKSGPYKDILSFDRPLSEAEQQILQELIDVTYGQFVATIAEARNLSIETVKTFADGRIFSGEQALALGVVDRLGTEDDARRWAAELAGVDPDRDCLTIADRKPLGNRLLGSQGNIQARSPLGSALLRIFGLVGAANLDPAIELGADWLALELATQGLPLWLYCP
jgi:protease IV